MVGEERHVEATGVDVDQVDPARDDRGRAHVRFTRIIGWNIGVRGAGAGEPEGCQQWRQDVSKLAMHGACPCREATAGARRLMYVRLPRTSWLEWRISPAE